MGQFAAFYKSKAWQVARAQQLAEQPWCVYCERMGRITDATVVDHVSRLSEDYDRRLDPTNLQSLCKTHHDSTKQREERTGMSAGCDVDGYPYEAAR